MAPDDEQCRRGVAQVDSRHLNLKNNNMRTAFSPAIKIIALLAALNVAGCSGGSSDSSSGTSSAGSGVSSGGSTSTPPDSVPSSPAVIPQSPAAGVLPVPTGLIGITEDHSAILEWNGGHPNPAWKDPAIVAGFQVEWWPADNASQKTTRITEYRRFQVQPMDNGRRYFATVSSIGHDGSISVASAPVELVASSARIDKLRTQMNAFFDDFNLPMGMPDERKWDVAYAICNDPVFNGFFINNQFHVHDIVSTLNGSCNIGQAISRTRQLFDLSDGGTRTITFDFDGNAGRDFMYIELAPRQPTFTHQGAQWRQGKALRPFSDSEIPLGLRIGQSGDGVFISHLDANGIEQHLAKGDMAWVGVTPLFNVRRRWEIRVSTTKAQVFIDGKSIVSTGLNIPATQYTMLWEEFSYNGPKANMPLSLHHWDNFGFDGPASSAPAVVTHNYRINNGGTDRVDAERWNNTVGRVKVNIPDSISGAKERRLLFTLSGHTATWEARDNVTINGRAFPMPEPRTALTRKYEIGTIYPYTFELTVPDGVLKTGVNDIVFETNKNTINNIHVEVDFTKGSEPTYTQPARVASGTGLPSVMVIGPNVDLYRLQNQETWPGENRDHAYQPTDTKLNASGTVDLDIKVSNFSTLAGIGQAVGIKEVGFMVDGQVIERRSVNKVVAPPAVNIRFKWDTTSVADGIHEVMEYACNVDGTASLFHGINGEYYPLHVRVNNRGGSSQVFKATVAPDIKGLCNSIPVERDHNH